MGLEVGVWGETKRLWWKSGDSWPADPVLGQLTRWPRASAFCDRQCQCALMDSWVPVMMTYFVPFIRFHNNNNNNNTNVVMRYTCSSTSEVVSCGRRAWIEWSVLCPATRQQQTTNSHRVQDVVSTVEPHLYIVCPLKTQSHYPVNSAERLSQSHTLLTLVSAAYAALVVVRCLSVCLGVRHVNVLYRNQ